MINSGIKWLWTTNGKLTSFLTVTAMLVYTIGCKQEAQRPAKAPAPASGIQVKSASDGIRFQTSVAEFVLNASGYLSAGLRNANGNLTLDQPDAETGQDVRIAGRKAGAHDFKFDLEHASISETSGKLGSTGKRLEVPGTSSSTGLSETLTVEVYDSFPRMALLSAHLAQRHAERCGTRRRVTSASSAECQARRFLALRRMRCGRLHGSSLKWGKDDVFPIPAKFSQENPFGTPVATKDDLGQVGGGIPVVAFWTRTSAKPSATLKRCRWRCRFRSRPDKDGLVRASVKVPRIPR